MKSCFTLRQRSGHLLVVLIVFCLAPPLWMAGSAEYTLEAIKTFPFRKLPPDGLDPSSYITYIEQDFDEFIWIATDQGLCRFDGHNQYRYIHQFGNENSLSDDFVNVVFCDSNQRVWIGTNAGLMYYRPSRDDFVRISLAGHIQDDNPGLPVKRIAQGADGRIYAGTLGGGVGILEKGLVSFSLSTVTQNPLDGMDNWEVNCIYFDASGRLWIATEEEGIYRYHPESGMLQSLNEFEALATALAEHEVRALHMDKSGYLWLGTHGNGLVRWHEGSGEIIHYSKNKGGNRFLEPESIRHLLEDGSGRIWLGTQDSGVHVYDPGEDRFAGLHHLDTANPKFDEQTITAMAMDKRGDMWFGGINSGMFYVFYLNMNPSGFRQAHMRDSEGKEISKYPTLAFFEDSKGDAWMGTDGHGLIRWNDSSCEQFLKNDDPYSISSDVVTAIREDALGNYWIGTRGGGLAKFDLDTGRFVTVPQGDDPDSLQGNTVWSLFIEGHHLWIGTEKGLSLLDIRSGETMDPRSVLGENFSMPKRAVWTIAKDRQGRMWIGSISGLYVSKPSMDTASTSTKRIGFECVSDIWIRCVYEDSSGRIWVGTHTRGLFCINGEGRMERGFPEGSNYEKGIVYSISGDFGDGLLINSNSGFFRQDKLTGKSVGVDTHWTFEAQRYWIYGSWPAKDGRIYFPSRKGLFFFESGPLELPFVDLEPRLTRLEVFDEFAVPQFAGAGGRPGNDSANRLTLKHNESPVTFHYSSFFYPNPVMVEYQAYLEGFDNGWQKATRQPSVTFNRLSPGDYTFHLRARLQGQEWGDAVSPLSVSIQGPVWLRWWFISGLLVLCLAAIYVFEQFQLRKSKRHRIHLEEMVAKRTQELRETNQRILQQRNELEYHRHHLEELVRERTAEFQAAKERAEESSRLKSAFLANMSHEIRTPLNAIVNFSQLLFDQKLTQEERIRFKDIVENSSSSLLRLIEDVLDIARLEAGELKLEKKPCDVVGMISLLREVYQEKLRVHRLNLELLTQVPSAFTNEIETDPIRLNQVMVNLLDNAVKFTDTGSVEFGFKEKGNQLEFFVRDTGIGIAPQNREKIFDRFTKIEEDRRKLFPGAGLGLAIAKRLVFLLGGRIWVESEESTGSTFHFTIPNKVLRKWDDTSMAFSVKRHFDWKGRSILVVEDEYSNVEVIKAFLSPTGVNIEFAGDGEQAVRKMRQDDGIDLILMDLKLPLMDGVTAARKIRDFNQRIPIIAQTAFGVTHERIDTLKNGFNDYVTKPLNKDRLLSSINHYLNCG